MWWSDIRAAHTFLITPVPIAEAREKLIPHVGLKTGPVKQIIAGEVICRPHWAIIVLDT